MYQGTKYHRSVWEQVAAMAPDHILDKEEFLGYHGGPQRLGQAFFNSLYGPYANRLHGSGFDPFYYDELSKVKAALGYLAE